MSKYGLEGGKKVSTPFEPGLVLGLEDSHETEEERRDMEAFPYRNLIGSLMYLAVWTRPDLAMSVSTLSRFCQNPGRKHWDAAKSVVRYLKETAGERLFYGVGEDVAVWGYSDARYGSDPETMRGRYGYVFRSGGGAVSWGSKL